jgi:ABC-type antimicrobial peptide transport system permease subunit
MGVYGVMAHAVTRRFREMGIRSALGARPREVLALVLAGGFRLALPGLVLGLLAALVVARLLRGLLLGVSPLDLWAFGLVALVVGAMVVLGTAVPARRAARVDPAEALRYD